MDTDPGLHAERAPWLLSWPGARARSWVQEQLREHGGDLWISGAEDYARHARDLLQDFADVISQRKEEPAAAGDSGTAAQVPVPTSGVVLSTEICAGRWTRCSRPAHVPPSQAMPHPGKRAAWCFSVPAHS